MDDRGDAAVAFTREKPESPQLATAFSAARTAGGDVSAPSLLGGGSGGAAVGLAAGATGRTMAALIGRAAPGQRCCSFVEVRRLAAGGGVGAPRRLFGTVRGETAGTIVGLPGRLLAAVASIDGVWASQQGPGGFGPPRRLSADGQLVENLAGAAAPDGHSAIAWTVADPQDPDAAPPAIEVATGTTLSAPGATRLAAVLPAARGVEELAVVLDRGPVLGWIEGWVDAEGVAHTSVRVMPVGGTVRSFAADGFASGLSLTGDGRGDDVLSFRSCTRSGACQVHAAVKRRGGSFGPGHVVGAADTSSTPSLAVLGDGSAVLAWVSDGNVEASALGASFSRFGRPVTVVSGGDATSVVLGAGGRRVVAAAVRGVKVPRLDGAVFELPAGSKRKPR